MADVSIEVSKEVVRPIIEAKIEAAIVAELTKVQPQLIEEMVRKLLSIKVDRDGKQSGYSSGVPFIEWLVRDSVMKMTKEAIVEIVETQKPAIKKELMKALTRNRAPMAEAFVAHLNDAVKDSWRTNVTVQFALPPSE